MQEFFAQNGRKVGGPDGILVWSTIGLVVAGLYILSTASSYLGSIQFADSWYFVKRQILQGVLLGGAGFFIFAHLRYELLNRRWVTVGLLGLSLLLILAVFTPLGMTLNGATRWLSIGGFSFQPAELLKPALVLYLASWLAFKDHRQRTVMSGLLPFLVIIGMVGGILIMQRSTAPVAVLMGTAVVMYFLSGARLRYVGIVVLIGVAALSFVINITGYRSQRITSFLDQTSDLTNANYQSNQAKTSFSAGGLTGAGYGNGVIKKRLPEPAGDSIFAVVGEEFGFLGSTALALAFALLVGRLFILSQSCGDPFGRLILIGIATIIIGQVFLNMGAMVGLIPLTGTPLPFISYGGTHLAIFMSMMGVAVSISRRIVNDKPPKIR